MHQPPEDYVPPVGTQLAGMAIGFAVVWMIGSGMADSGFLGFLAGAIVGCPGGLVASYVYHYISLAPVREDDRRRYEERKVRYAEEARRKKEAYQARRKVELERRERNERLMDESMERDIAAGKMNYKLGKYLERKAEEAAKRAEAL